jgi:prepilin signal peptidase PulO-like enzyme (type II secretory pathway)
MLILFLFILGAAMGSFANATAWRLKHKRDFVKERSECEFCHHALGASDLIPIISWLWLKGKCRYCHKKISPGHLIVELLTAVLFAASYLWWPGGLHNTAAYAQFGFWLVYVVGIVLLGVYDLKWLLLPDKIVFPLIGLSIVGTVVGRVWLGHEGFSALVDVGAGITVFAGFLGALFAFSKGRWVGLGDVKLAIFMGIVLGVPNAVLALLGSYYIGAFVTAPLLMSKKLTLKSQVPFGPFLLASFWLSFLFGDKVVHWLRVVV